MNKSYFLILVGKRIKHLRALNALSQAELARRCYKDPQAIERIENGKINTSIYMIKVIADALEVDPMEILNIENG
ncbi:MAG: helix-turn-helix transcriptional regulator [Cryomorphaceae bacterium]|nr:helix-turn-helix transcriptional regulator [Cryomorphaceae bacterium]